MFQRICVNAVDHNKTIVELTCRYRHAECTYKYSLDIQHLGCYKSSNKQPKWTSTRGQSFFNNQEVGQPLVK